MSAKEKRNEPKQKTRKGYEIPVPQRSEFFGNLGKVAKTNSETKRRPKK